MAQKVQVILVDDLEGGDADETVAFSLDGVQYEIDLNGENAASLREEFGHWIGHARRVGGRQSRRGQKAPVAKASSANDTAAIRAWARENGYSVSDRGRISGEVLEAYENR